MKRECDRNTIGAGRPLHLHQIPMTVDNLFDNFHSEAVL